MSTCISREGEYSDHEPGDYCPRCGVFNEAAILAERDSLREKLTRPLPSDVHDADWWRRSASFWAEHAEQVERERDALRADLKDWEDVGAPAYAAAHDEALDELRAERDEWKAKAEARP